MNHALLVWYILAAIGLLVGAHNHGKPDTRPPHNFFAILIVWAVRLVLVWWATGWRFF
jgi:hypothetical protein